MHAFIGMMYSHFCLQLSGILLIFIWHKTHALSLPYIQHSNNIKEFDWYCNLIESYCYESRIGQYKLPLDWALLFIVPTRNVMDM